MSSLEPFFHSSGPRDARVVLVGEAFGERETLCGKPFMGASGQELIRMLREAWELPVDVTEDIIAGMWPDSRLSPESTLSLREMWLKKHGVLLTAVFPLRPGTDNNIENLCVSRREVSDSYSLPPLKMGKYFPEELLPHVARLRLELETVRPNLIVCLGNTACWAVLQATNIGSIRGAITTGSLAPNIKVLPTYHPAGVLRNWAWRPIVLADLMKAKREARFPEFKRPEREVLVSPTLVEAYAWIGKYITEANPPMISCDIETFAGQITCMGFAPRRDRAISIPFWLPEQKVENFWASPSDEAKAWRLIQMVLEGPWPKLFQNGMYDLQYLYKFGFRPQACSADTMLLHHSLFPELQKGLGFLGSIYSSEAPWKLMRKQDSFKKDE